MAINSYMTYLLKKDSTGDTYSKVCDIKSMPELGGKPERLETTTLSNANRTYIPGIKDFGESEFSLNYDVDEYSDLVSGEGTDGNFAVALGAEIESGHVKYGKYGSWKFRGQYYMSKDSADVNSVQGATLTMYVSSDYTFSSAELTSTDTTM